MQKLFLLSYILMCLWIPIRRARREEPYPVGRILTDITIYGVAFGLFLRFFYLKLPS